jgi:anti-sigma regulatory factor (Ser/Thr protein kinase)
MGGLGVYLVKKTMDEVSYEHVDGRNILRITKNI